MYTKTKAVISGRNSTSTVRGIAIVNGYQVRFKEFTIEQNGFSAANSFELRLPFFVQDTQSGEMILANGPDFDTQLLEIDSIPVQLYVGNPKDPQNYTTSDLTLLFNGYMDTARWEFRKSGETLTLKGRNIVGKMIDYKLNNKYPNLTSSAIAEMFASEIGLTPVITPTTTLAGTWYNQNSAVIGRETTVWDLLLFLAKAENFIVRVTTDNKLLFGPYSDVTSYESTTPIPYTWGYDIESINFERSPHAAKNIVVKVISYSRTLNKKGTKYTDHHIEETTKTTTEKSQTIKGQTGEREQYTEIYVIPGLTRDQAQRKAQSILDELSRSEIIGNFTAAGNTDLNIDRQVVIYGVGLTLSQNYYLNRVSHRFSLQDGYMVDTSFSNQYLINTTVDSTQSE